LVNVKQKGNRGERDIANILTTMTEVKWNRVPCSGAIFTTGGDSDLKGDVYCKDTEYKDITIEVKNHTGCVSINDIFNKKSKFHKWVDQLKEECLGDDGFLFFKSSRKWFWYHVKKSNVSTNCTFVYKLKDISKTYHNFGELVK